MTKTVKGVIAEITPESGYARFSKRNFNDLMMALMNDTEFAAEVAVVKNKELADIQKIFVAKEFRKFLKKVLMKAGMDQSDASAVMDPSFEIDFTDGLYEFFATAIYEYVDAHNKFTLLPREDFDGGSIALKTVAEKSTTSRCRNPKTQEDLGLWERTTRKHKVLTVSSPAPAYLKTRRRVKE